MTQAPVTPAQAAIIGERIALLEVVSTLRTMAQEVEGDIVPGVYRALIQLFENRIAAVEVRLEQERA